MRKAKVDNNQPQIVRAYKGVGALVLHTHTLKNCCDLVVSYRGRTMYVEIKDPISAKFPKYFWDMNDKEREVYLVENHLTEGEREFREKALQKQAEYWIVYDTKSVMQSLRQPQR